MADTAKEYSFFSCFIKKFKKIFKIPPLVYMYYLLAVYVNGNMSYYVYISVQEVIYVEQGNDKALDTRLLGARIREARELISDKQGKKLSQEELAYMMNLTATYIRHVEGGQRTPRLKCFVDFCKILNTTPNYLLKDYLEEEYLIIIDEIIHKIETVRPDKLPLLLENIKLLDDLK